MVTTKIIQCNKIYYHKATALHYILHHICAHVKVDPTETETSLTSAPSIPSPKSGNKIFSITLIPILSLGSVFLNLNYIFP